MASLRWPNTGKMVPRTAPAQGVRRAALRRSPRGRGLRRGARPAGAERAGFRPGCGARSGRGAVGSWQRVLFGQADSAGEVGGEAGRSPPRPAFGRDPRVERWRWRVGEATRSARTGRGARGRHGLRRGAGPQEQLDQAEEAGLGPRAQPRGAVEVDPAPVERAVAARLVAGGARQDLALQPVGAGKAPERAGEALDQQAGQGIGGTEVSEQPVADRVPGTARLADGTDRALRAPAVPPRGGDLRGRARLATRLLGRRLEQLCGIGGGDRRGTGSCSTSGRWAPSAERERRGIRNLIL